MKMIKFSFFPTKYHTCWKCIITLPWVRLKQMWSISFLWVFVVLWTTLVNTRKYKKKTHLKQNKTKQKTNNRFLITTIEPKYPPPPHPPPKKGNWKFNSNKKAILFSNYFLSEQNIVNKLQHYSLTFILLDK